MEKQDRRKICVPFWGGGYTPQLKENDEVIESKKKNGKGRGEKRRHIEESLRVPSTKTRENGSWRRNEKNKKEVVGLGPQKKDNELPRCICPQGKRSDKLQTTNGLLKKMNDASRGGKAKHSNKKKKPGKRAYFLQDGRRYEDRPRTIGETL